MKAFLWSNVSKCTERYHSGGAVLIEAENLERAREIGVFKYDEYTDQGEVEATARISDLEREPDAVFETTGEEKVWVFPNSGCC